MLPLSCKAVERQANGCHRPGKRSHVLCGVAKVQLQRIQQGLAEHCALNGCKTADGENGLVDMQTEHWHASLLQETACPVLRGQEILVVALQDNTTPQGVLWALHLLQDLPSGPSHNWCPLCETKYTTEVAEVADSHQQRSPGVHSPVCIQLHHEHCVRPHSANDVWP